MIEKKASRIFQEMSLIERLLNKSIDNYNPTGDDDLDVLGIDLSKIDWSQFEIDTRDGFVMCLRDIAQDMTFGDWQDFWLDMGIRIYDAEEEWDEDFTDITDDLEDD